jgi:hypothetical protein
MPTEKRKAVMAEGNAPREDLVCKNVPTNPVDVYNSLASPGADESANAPRIYQRMPEGEITFHKVELWRLSEAIFEACEHLNEKLENESDYTPSELKAIGEKIAQLSVIGYRIDAQLYSRP